MVQRLTVTVTTAADGSATAYSDTILPAGGFIEQVRYVKTDFADTVDFDITVEDTGEVIWSEDNVTASATKCPRQPTHSTLGAALVYAAADAVADKIVMAKGRIQIDVANGGNTKTGTFHFIVS